MAVMGTVPTTSEMPYFDWFTYNAPGWVLNPSTTTYLNFDTVTMPWPGNLFVTVEWCMYWQHRQQVVLYSNSSPGHTNATGFNIIDDGLGYCFVVHHLNIWWQNLAEGQAVTVGVRLDVGGGGSTVSSDQYTVNSRGFRA